MADVHQHTPPGGWPRGKGKDIGDHQSRDQSPSQYFDDDSTVVQKDTKDAATDTTESTTKSLKKHADDSSQEEDDSPDEPVKSAKKSTTKKAKSTKDSADNTAKSTKGSADKEAKSAKDSTEKKVKSTKDSADNTAKSTKDSTDDTAKSAKDTADKKAKSAKDAADDTTKSTKDTADKAVKSAKSKGDSDSKEEKVPESNPMDELKAGLKGGDDSKLKEVEPEPIELTDEEKNKLTPGGDISNVTKAAEEVESKKDDVPKADEAKEGVTDAAEDATKDDVPKADEAKEGVTDAAEDATKDAPKTDLPEGEDAVKEGKDAAADAEAKVDETGNDVEAPEGAEVPKEGEEALKEGQETADEAAEEGKGTSEEAVKEGEEEGKETSEEAVKEGEEAAKEGEEAVEQEAPIDLSILKSAKVNKGGILISDDNKVVGRVKEGVLAHLVGKRCDENGIIWSDSGKPLGKAELIPDDEREAMDKEAAPFEAFPDAKVDSEGFVVSGDERVGKVVEGDIKKLRNMKVDADGDILDRQGSVVGRAERWEPEAEPEPEPEPEKDRSILAGKRVNKAGYLVDSSGAIFGKVIEGDAKRMIGRMSDAKGVIRSESGDELGRAEVVPEGEREGTKEGPFAELSGCTVRKDGKIVTPGNEVVGRLVSGDPKVLFGREVDDDGEICDKNGNVIGKAERWEEPEVEKRQGPLAGRKVNKEGLVTDSDGNVIAKLTSGDLSVCAGKEIDDDNDVVDGKGTTVGHVTLLADIKEPEESADDKAKREKAEQDKKLAQQMSYCLTQCLDKIKPICQMITSKIEKAERMPKEELDEEELVRDVRPLIEEGGKILQEANGIIRGLDPDGRIQANAKHKTATHEATPEEYHLADILKELTGTVTQTIDNAKKKIEGMPHAKKELNPLWGLLSEPLFQILAAVGLLLNGVLGLVGRLLSGLGLGGLVDSLLGGLGVKNILEALGVGGLTDSLTGKNQKGGKKKGGGLLGLGG